MGKCFSSSGFRLSEIKPCHNPDSVKSWKNSDIGAMVVFLRRTNPALEPSHWDS